MAEEQEDKVELGNVKFAKELDLMTFVGNGPRYRYLRKTQQTGSESLTLPVASSTTAVFELPADVYNFSKSKLMFALAIPARTLNQVYRYDFPPIDRIVLKTRNGKELVDIRECRDYWMMVKDHQTPVDKLDGKGGYATTLANAKLYGLTTWNNACMPVAGLYSQTPEATADDGKGGTGLRMYASDDGYQAPGAFYNSVVPTHTVSTVSVINDVALSAHCCLHFDKLYDTILSINRDLPLVEACNLEITFAPAQSFLSGCTGLADLKTGAVAPAAASTITELALYLAVEQDEYNRKQVWDKVYGIGDFAGKQPGLHLAVPYVHVMTQALPAQTSASIQFKLNKGHGQRLLRIYSSQKLPDDNIVICNHSNLSDIATCVNSIIYHLFDSKRLEDEDLDETSYDSFYQMEPLMKGSLAHYNGARYFYSKCPSHVSDFSVCSKLINASEDNLIISGYDLTKEVLFNRVYRTRAATAQTAIFVVVVQKELAIEPTGIFIE